MIAAFKALARGGAVALALAAPTWSLIAPTRGVAQDIGQAALPVKDRNSNVSREGAAKLPRSEGDQALADGWPLYRSERGQAAFNDAMATLKATDGAAPAPAAFKGCAGLACNLSLPSLTSDGWIPPGRLWVSPSEYVLFVHSPRLRQGQSYQRRASRDMRYFVFHEFANSSHNTDLYDTIASHSRSVFVPLYMSKGFTDAKGRRFVVVVQVAPHDVVCMHATNRGSAGPGIEVAKNLPDALEPLQGLAGVLVATIIKTAAPQLEVVNHQDSEGLPMLTQYKRRLETLRNGPAAPSVALPFVPASAQRVATATARLGDLILLHGASPPIPVAMRGIVPPRDGIASSAAGSASQPPADDRMPALIGPIRLATRPAPRPEPVLVRPIQPATRPASAPAGTAVR